MTLYLQKNALMRVCVLLKIILFFMIQVAQGNPDSAYRKAGVPYEYYEQRALDASGNQKSRGSIVLGVARLYGTGRLSTPTIWDSYQVLQERFEFMRDLRFLPWKKGFHRRSTWLYPDDGCFIRAALAVRNLYQKGISPPSKVFAFGKLRIKTPNSPRGRVGWWYHVAPIVQVDDKKYVLDPAIESSRPMELYEWLKRMGKPEKIKVAICYSGSNVPRSACYRRTKGSESWALKSQKPYLSLEWNRLKILKRNPERELGDEPPW